MITEENRKWWILAAMGCVLGIVLLDETIVGVALPTIQKDLALTDLLSHWVVNSYLLVFAGLVAAGGRLGDIFGLRILFSIGILIFGVSSLACGIANDSNLLIAARAAQGVGAAIIFPASMAMITIVFPEEQRGMAIGIYGSIGTVGLMLGPFVGGMLTELISWRWIFWINPPVVLVIAGLVLSAWTDPPIEKIKTRFDFGGLASLVVGLGLVVFAVMQGPEWGWNHPTIWSFLIAGLAIFLAFVLIELRTSFPLIEVDLFANSSFAVCNLVVFTAQVSKMAFFIFGAAYLQQVQGMSAIQAGIAMLPSVVPAPFSGPLAGRAADWLGARKPTLMGLTAVAAGLLWFGIASEWNNYLILIPALVVWGAALPFLFVPPMRAIMNEVPIDKQGLAGGIVLCAQLLGGTIGIAACSTLFSSFKDYGIIFLATGVFTVLVLVLSYFKIEPEQTIPAPETS